VPLNVPTYSHNKTRQPHIRTQPLADARTLPHGIQPGVLARVDEARRDVVRIRRGADEEEDDDEEGLEVEEGRLSIVNPQAPFERGERAYHCVGVEEGGEVCAGRRRSVPGRRAREV
jgi:hypothetical protein